MFNDFPKNILRALKESEPELRLKVLNANPIKVNCLVIPL